MRSYARGRFFEHSQGRYECLMCNHRGRDRRFSLESCCSKCGDWAILPMPDLMLLEGGYQAKVLSMLPTKPTKEA